MYTSVTTKRVFSIFTGLGFGLALAACAVESEVSSPERIDQSSAAQVCIGDLCAPELNLPLTNSSFTSSVNMDVTPLQVVSNVDFAPLQVVSTDRGTSVTGGGSFESGSSSGTRTTSATSGGTSSTGGTGFGTSMSIQTSGGTGANGLSQPVTSVSSTMAGPAFSTCLGIGCK